MSENAPTNPKRLEFEEKLKQYEEMMEDIWRDTYYSMTWKRESEPKQTTQNTSATMKGRKP